MKMGSSKVGLLNSDCLDAMKKMPDNSIDAIVTDPPYGLSFMGKNWDFGVPGVEFWKEALRIAKPGAHLLSFGGTRTFHRIACAIEDAGWEVRDTMMWLYGSGFPKSMDISKAIDKKLGAEREVVGVAGRSGTKRNCMNTDFKGGEYMETLPGSEEAKKWSGWGTCLKPAYEPIIMARKPIEGTVADNVMKHGVGGINIDECRVPTTDNVSTHADRGKETRMPGWNYKAKQQHQTPGQKLGRFPANIIHDGSDEVIDAFDNKLTPNFTPIVLARKPIEGTVADNVLKYGVGGLNIDECRVPFESEADKASAKPQGRATAKVGALAGGVENDRERTEFTPKEVSGRFPANILHDGSDEVVGLFPNTGTSAGGGKHTKGVGDNQQGNAFGSYSGGQPQDTIGYGDSGSAARFFYCAKASKSERGEGNIHPTVKPIALMEYLVKLITPEGGIVLDPFMGSGTTGIAAMNLNRGFIGIEKEPEYFNIAKSRIERAENGK